MSVAVQGAATKLLDFTQPIDVPLLDATVGAFYGAGSQEEVSNSELQYPVLATK